MILIVPAAISCRSTSCVRTLMATPLCHALRSRPSAVSQTAPMVSPHWSPHSMQHRGRCTAHFMQEMATVVTSGVWSPQLSSRGAGWAQAGEGQVPDVSRDHTCLPANCATGYPQVYQRCKKVHNPGDGTRHRTYGPCIVGACGPAGSAG